MNENVASRYLSIITNFGCHYTCPYCIVRENNLHIPATTIDGLTALSAKVKELGCNMISLSGGGDPLFGYLNHRDWYNEFFKIIPNPDNRELHTSYFATPNFPYNEFYRVVYHLRSIDDIFRIRRRGHELVRVVFVVTDLFTKGMIDRIATLCKANPNIDELSFRQMVDSNYQATHYCEDYLTAGHKKNWWYITQCDYNLYYCENKVSTRFEDFKTDQI